MILRGLTRKLAALEVQAVAEAALAAEAGRIAGAVATEHGEVRIDGDRAEIGWRLAALRWRELGEVGKPPEPGLGAVAAVHGARAAEAVGRAVADALREE